MQSTFFTQQGTLSSTYDDNSIYTPSLDGEYPEAFSVGYVKSSNIPPQFIPSYFKASYAPDINTERVAGLIPDTQDSIYDVFLGGINNNNSMLLNGDSIVVGGFNTREYDRRQSTPNFTKRMNSYLIYGKCDVRGMCMPSAINICIKFTGMKNGNNIFYETVFNRNFNIDELIAVVKNNDNQYSIIDGNVTFNLLDFKDNRYLFVDEGTDSDTCGFYWLCYSFVGWGRNKYDDASLGNYSYLFPSIGVQLGEIQETISEGVNKYATWNITSLYGTAPYGTARRSSWGPGLRTRATGAGLYPGTYYEEEGISEIYQAELQNASYASFLTLGYSINVSGFTCCSPIQPSTGSLISIWSYTVVREYAAKLSPADEQLVLFVPEGRGDFGTTVQIASINDVWKHACLVPVWCRPGSEYTFATNNENFWYAEMDGYEFVSNLIRGDEPSLQDKVPEWILEGDSTLNEYEPETDRPTGGDDDDNPVDDNFDHTDGSGDSIIAGYGDLSLAGVSGSTYVSCGYTGIIALKNALANASVSTFWNKLGKEITGTVGSDAYQLLLSADSGSILNYINSIRMYPLNVTNLSGISGSSVTNLNFGFNGASLTPTGVSTGYSSLNNTIGTFDMGTVYINPLQQEQGFWDFEPYTTISITLPSIGTFPLDAKRVIGRTLSLIYIIDLTTGNATANVTTNINGIEVPVLCKTGQMAINISMSGNDIITQAENIANAELNNMSLFINTVTGLGNSIASKDLAGIATGVGNSGINITRGLLNASKASRDVPNTVTSAGGLGSNTITRVAYITIRRPYIDLPKRYGHFNGFLIKQSYSVGTLSGYTVCSDVDTSSITYATSEERNMIKNILTTGFYA